MKASDVTIEVKARLSVERRTAEACLKMVEMYINETGENIIGTREKNGEYSFSLTGGNHD